MHRSNRTTSRAGLLRARASSSSFCSQVVSDSEQRVESDPWRSRPGSPQRFSTRTGQKKSALRCCLCGPPVDIPPLFSVEQLILRTVRVTLAKRWDHDTLARRNSLGCGGKILANGTLDQTHFRCAQNTDRSQRRYLPNPITPL